MADLLALSARYLDEGIYEGPASINRVTGELSELATQAEPESRDAHAARAEIYEQRRKQELSLMARGIYGHAARESARVSGRSL